MQKQTINKQQFDIQLANLLKNCTLLSYNNKQLQLVFNNNTRIILNYVQNNNIQIVMHNDLDTCNTICNVTKTVNK